MARITHRDFETLQSGLRRLYAHHSLDTLPRAALKLACELVPNDLAAYNEVDPSRRRLQVAFEPDPDGPEFFELIPTWERYMHQHPVLAHFHKNPAADPKKISDFLSDRDFRKLELYREFYAKINANYQIAVNMPSPGPLVVALAFNREKRDFSERDRKLLGMLRPHMRQAYENAVVVSELAEQLGDAYDALDRIDRAVVAIDDECRVHTASPAATRFSVEHFRGETDATLATRLPDTLNRWASEQMIALDQLDDEARRPSPLIVEGPHGRLLTRIVADRQPRRYLLFMHLARPLESSAPLVELGLTRREAEVLFWMIDGRTNSQIAEHLGTSERTIDKHAQHLYAKLDVAGRAEAITKALEWLRL